MTLEFPELNTIAFRARVQVEALSNKAMARILANEERSHRFDTTTRVKSTVSWQLKFSCCNSLHRPEYLSVIELGPPRNWPIKIPSLCQKCVGYLCDTILNN